MIPIHVKQMENVFRKDTISAVCVHFTALETLVSMRGPARVTGTRVRTEARVENHTWETSSVCADLASRAQSVR